MEEMTLEKAMREEREHKAACSQWATDSPIIIAAQDRVYREKRHNDQAAWSALRQMVRCEECRRLIDARSGA